MNFTCEKCGHEESKIGRIGNTGYDLVKKPGKMFGGTSILVTCCAECGEVESMRVEHPEKL